MKKISAFLVFLIMSASFLLTTQSQAAEEAAAVNNINSVTTKVEGEAGNHWYSNPTPVLGIKSYTDTSRFNTIGLPNARVLKSKNEAFLGVKSQSGWGVFGQMVEYVHEYSNNTLNKSTAGDPSFSLMHPVYKDDKITITGLLREYFPVTDRGVNRSQYQQAYYSNLLIKLPKRLDFFNQAVPRYFTQSYYQGGDTQFAFEDWTTVTRKLNSWCRLGLGQHFEMDIHSTTPTGKIMEVFPMADFMLTPTIFMGPRIYIPVAAQNTVFEGPTQVSLSNVEAELYIQATL